MVTTNMLRIITTISCFIFICTSSFVRDKLSQRKPPTPMLRKPPTSMQNKLPTLMLNILATDSINHNNDYEVKQRNKFKDVIFECIKIYFFGLFLGCAL